MRPKVQDKRPNHEGEGTMPVPFVFADLRTRDVDATRRFYGDLLGWTVVEQQAGPTSVLLFQDGGEPEPPWGGVTPLDADDERNPMWIPYADVPDVDAAADQAEALGGRIVRPRVDLPVGSVVVVEDPSGATLALWESAPAA
jgi:predicted enzyme related to lactoylglutathione lyase